MSRGFTLVQVSIILIVASLVLVNLLPSTRTNLTANNTSVTRMNAIMTALRGYEAANARLPCPADASQPINSTSYGVAAANYGTGSPGNCTGGSPAANFVDTTNQVAIGMVPVRALGLSNDYALDGFGRDFTYAVDTNATSCFSGTLTGQIAVYDAGQGANVNTVTAIVSHGPDGHGAWLPLTGSNGSAVRLNAGSTDTDQLVNAHLLTTGTFPNSTSSSLVTTAESTTSTFVKKPPTATFDDLLVYKSNLWNINASPVAAAALLPSVTTYPASGNYYTGQTLTFILTWGSAVTVTGTPEIALTIPQSSGSNATHYATYNTSSSSNNPSGGALAFTYTVVSTDYAPSGISMASTVTLNSGTITQTSSGAALCLAFTAPSLTGVLLNPPTVYVGDYPENNRVEMFNASGSYVGQIGCSTGDCSSGSGNGQFNDVSGIAVDSSGNVWVGDILNYRMQKFNNTGSYLAQFGSSAGYLDAVAIDSGNNIWQTDINTKDVLKYSSSGSLVKTIGSAGTASGKFETPYYDAIDGNGNLWVSDWQDARVEVFNGSTGSFMFQVGCSSGKCSDGSGNGQFSGSAEGIAVDGSGDIWVVDEGNYRVQEFSNGGSYLGQFSTGTPTDSYPYDTAIAIDPSGNFWIGNQTNSQIDVFSSCGVYVTAYGSAGTGNGQFGTSLAPGYMAISGPKGGGGACVASITAPNGNYNTGQTLTFTVTFSSAVTVSGTPELVLNVGGTTRDANYASGSGTATLTFTYTIQSSDSATGISTSSINLNGGTITTVSNSASANLAFTTQTFGGILANSTAFILVADSLNERVQALNLAGSFLDQIGCASGACSTSTANGGFNDPFDVAVDSGGNIWVADHSNHRVEKFNSAGSYLSQLGCASGTCTAGSASGQFNGPLGITIDGSNDVWVADENNYRVQEFNSSGSYLLQLGTTGSSACSANHFKFPQYLHVDSNGNIDVNDNTCGQIEQFNSSGSYIQTFGPTVPGYSKGTYSEGDMDDFAFDSCRNMWIQDEGNNYLVETDYAGNFLQQISNSIGMESIAIDGAGGILSLSENSADDITVYNGAGTITATLGNGDGSNAGYFNDANGLAIVGSSVAYLRFSSCAAVSAGVSSPANAYYTVGQMLTFTITYDQAVTVTGTPQLSVTIGSNTHTLNYSGGSGTTSITFTGYTLASSDFSMTNGVTALSISLNGGTMENSGGINANLRSPNLGSVLVGAPSGITQDASGNLWVVDTNNNRVQKFTSAGTYSAKYGTSGTGNGNFAAPLGIAFNSAGSFVWVTDTGNNRVEEFNSSGTYQSQFGAAGTGGGDFESPTGIAVDSSGNIWVVDTGNDRIEEFNSAGSYASQFGSLGSSAGLFNNPVGIAIDSSSNLWIADTGNNQIQKCTTGGSCTVYGSAGTGSGQFSAPWGIATDNTNNYVWVSDAGNSRVQRFDLSGSYLGQAGSSGTGNGNFNGPAGITVVNTGGTFIWVVDTGNSRVEKFNSSGTYQSKFGGSGTGNGDFSFR